MLSKVDPAPLYANYGRTSDQEIRDLLTRQIKLVELSSRFEQPLPEGASIIGGWYALSKKTLTRVVSGPRTFSYAFEFGQAGDYIDCKELKAFKALPFLVKSSSHMLLKPDIGEVIDQMSEEDKAVTTAIFINRSNHFCLNTPNYDEFIVEATLYKAAI
jgi:hypothetical protein